MATNFDNCLISEFLSHTALKNVYSTQINDWLLKSTAAVVQCGAISLIHLKLNIHSFQKHSTPKHRLIRKWRRVHK